MKILYITNICNIGEILVKEAGHQDIDAHYIEYPWVKRNPTNFFHFFQFLMKNNIARFDVFHYNWPIATLLPRNKDIRYLRNQNKKVFLHYHGDDIRNKKEREQLKCVDGKIISTPDLQKFLLDGEWVPFPYDTRGLQKRKGWNNIIKIIHAPSDRERKGTAHILRAIKNLKQKYEIDFELIEGKSNEYVLRKMAYSDIVIDQIGPGWYGKVTLEALYSGAVSCFSLNPDLADHLPMKFYCAITEKNMVARIGEIIEDEGLRNKMRAEGYRYLTQYHDSKKIMQHLLEMYGHH